MTYLFLAVFQTLYILVSYPLVKIVRIIIRICKTITCSMKGENQILLTIQELLKIKVGETTPDGNFSLLQTNCLGFCHKAPAMLINNEVYNELTPDKVREILTSYINSNVEGTKNDINTSA